MNAHEFSPPITRGYLQAVVARCRELAGLLERPPVEKANQFGHLVEVPAEPSHRGKRGRKRTSERSTRVERFVGSRRSSPPVPRALAGTLLVDIKRLAPGARPKGLDKLEKILTDVDDLLRDAFDGDGVVVGGCGEEDVIPFPSREKAGLLIPALYRIDEELVFQLLDVKAEPASGEEDDDENASGKPVGKASIPRHLSVPAGEDPQKHGWRRIDKAKLLKSSPELASLSKTSLRRKLKARGLISYCQKWYGHAGSQPHLRDFFG